MSSKARKPMSKKNKIRRIAEDVIMVCLIAIMLISGWKIYTIIRDYRSSQANYDKIAGESRDGEFTGDIDFDALRKINPDVIGWIYYESSHIDYPIVQGTDNDKYLYTMFDGTPGGFGCLFADAKTDKAFKQFNTIVYGHHMRNGSMFADLKKLQDQEYCREHPRMELVTPEGKFHLEICAFLNQPSDSEIYTTNIVDLGERNEYLGLLNNLASYTTNEVMDIRDRLVILSTCVDATGPNRYIVVCKMVPWEGENIDMSYEESGSVERDNTEAGGEEGEAETEEY